jgi:hypothetical protein
MTVTIGWNELAWFGLGVLAAYLLWDKIHSLTKLIKDTLSKPNG